MCSRRGLEAETWKVKTVYASVGASSVFVERLKQCHFCRNWIVAVSRGSAESRQRALWYATDLLIAGHYTDDEIWMFGEIIGRLEQDIETAARAQLARRLARADNAPIKMINKLAFDDSIDVAGPVLRQSERLDVRRLGRQRQVRKASNIFLQYPSESRSSEDVTDVLVTRGNREVVRSVATNNGARFSDFGILQMIKRSESNSILVEQLGRRKDIPRHLFQQLIAKASDNTKKEAREGAPGGGDADSNPRSPRSPAAAFEIWAGLEELFRCEKSSWQDEISTAI